jgi:hypothetical protein
MAANREREREREREIYLRAQRNTRAQRAVQHMVKSIQISGQRVKLKVKRNKVDVLFERSYTSGPIKEALRN